MECMWCSSTERCVDSNAYIISFPYGQCLEWQTATCSREYGWKEIWPLRALKIMGNTLSKTKIYLCYQPLIFSVCSFWICCDITILSLGVTRLLNPERNVQQPMFPNGSFLQGFGVFEVSLAHFSSPPCFSYVTDTPEESTPVVF